MFENLTFRERRILAGKLMSAARVCRYEVMHLRHNPSAVCYEGQDINEYRALVDDAQALVDDVHAIDIAQGL